jgi:signal transduction histidine kinase
MVLPRVVRWWHIVGVATLLGIFSSCMAYQAVRLLSEKPQRFITLAGINFSFWYSWALLAPIVLWLSRRFVFERGRWRRSLATHIAASILLTATHVGLSEFVNVQVIRYSWREPRLGWWARIESNIVMNVDWEMAIYWAIIASSYAIGYYREAQSRTLRAATLETQLAEAQLQALQRQLHPHFLFNTLNAISALMHRDVEAADQMLTRLSDLLRMALDQRAMQEVALKDELEFLAKYLEIEQARFGDRLTVRFDIDPITLDAQVPNLLLQPIVENSVRHGIAARIDSGVIEICARRADGRLELQVRDNGPGLPNAVSPQPHKGVGLSTTRSRLEHLYGPEQRFEFSQPAGGGLVVTIAIPFRSDDPVDLAEDLGEDMKGVA